MKWVLIALLIASPVHAGFEAGGFQPVATVGLIQGNGDNHDVQIRELGVSLGHYFRDGLGFYSNFSLHGPRGTREFESVDTYGLGLSFGLRWHFVRHRNISLYTDWNMGFIVTRDPFPPAGTNFNGTPNFGLGLTAQIKGPIRLIAGFRHLHISNGRGIVERNPSFDGVGGYAGIAWNPGYRAPVPSIRDTLPFGGKEVKWRVEANLEFVDEERSPGGIVALDFPLLKTARIHGQGEFRGAELAGEFTWEAAFRIYRQTDSGRQVLSYSRKEFNVFTSDFYQLQIDHILNDVSTIQFFAGVEHKNLADDRVFGGLYIAVYILDALSLRSGTSFERKRDDTLESLESLDDGGFGIGLDYSPGPLSRYGLTVFFSLGNGNDLKIIGIRLQPGGSQSVRERHRHGSFIPLR